MRALTSKERLLSIVFGGLLFLACNVIFLKWASNQIAQKRANLSDLKAVLAETEQLVAERPHWESRKAWVEQHQPELYLGTESDSQFAEAVQQSVVGNDLLIQSQDLHEANQQRPLVITTLDLTMEGRLESIVRWMQAIQRPGRYCAIENLTLKQAESGGKMALQVKVRKIFQTRQTASK